MKIHTGPKPPKMVKCPTCKGAGIQDIHSTTISPGKPVEKAVTKIVCIICKGAAVVHPKVVKALEREAAMWCRCEKPSDDIIFHDDFECGDCDKHHYHCGTCQKITQVG
jgi:hypothetical protein